MINERPHGLTKIICTIGTASSSVEVITEMVNHGMSVARLNMSHGTYESHQCTINSIREAERRLGTAIGIALDTKGHELRIGEIQEGCIIVKTGDEIILTNVHENTDKRVIYVPLESLSSLERGVQIFIDDGLLNLEVVEVHDSRVITKALNSHFIKSRKGVNIPGISLGHKGLSEEDKKSILFGLQNQVDFIFASFISSDDDIHEIRELTKEWNKKPEIISKVESKEGMQNLEKIIGTSDGIMIARGDLAVEIGHEKVFTAQKRISKLSLEKDKILICATQMLESMTNNMFPTRAEVSDVGNAVVDGCDAVMLSGETATGKYPVYAVKMMRNICTEAEGFIISEDAKQHHTACNIVDKTYSKKEQRKYIDTNKIEEIDILRHMHIHTPIYVSSNSEEVMHKIQIRRNCIPKPIKENLKLSS